MLVKDLIVEASVADGETCELPRVTVRVLAAGNRSLDKTVFEQFFIEIASVTA